MQPQIIVSQLKSDEKAENKGVLDEMKALQKLKAEFHFQSFGSKKDKKLKKRELNTKIRDFNKIFGHEVIDIL